LEGVWWAFSEKSLYGQRHSRIRALVAVTVFVCAPRHSVFRAASVYSIRRRVPAVLMGSRVGAGNMFRCSHHGATKAITPVMADLEKAVSDGGPSITHVTFGTYGWGKTSTKTLHKLVGSTVEVIDLQRAKKVAAQHNLADWAMPCFQQLKVFSYDWAVRQPMPTGRLVDASSRPSLHGLREVDAVETRFRSTM
jgi:hypothetical protein